jgi:hypothetical protein
MASKLSLARRRVIVAWWSGTKEMMGDVIGKEVEVDDR